MTQHLTIVTGASRGLGLELARQRLAQGHRVLAIARKPAALEGATVWTHDLADTSGAAARLAAWLSEQDPAQLGSATLINNAGVVSQPSPLSQGQTADLSNALRVGLEAPLLLTAAFLNATTAWALPRKVLLVSSGLGRRALAGSASYCAAKAGLDHLARSVALEEGGRPDGARIVSLAPGIIDTDMQLQLRSADPAQFANREMFAQWHATGALDSPAQAATKVLAYLDRADFGSNPVADVRDAG
jgi:NAD(P)-dependent dehydrogenase (short-subunit alcohol dehydrogenase family)